MSTNSLLLFVPRLLWMLLVFCWTPVRWMISLVILVQIIWALHEPGLLNWLKPFGLFSFMTWFWWFGANVPHPWFESESDEKAARAVHQRSTK